MAILCNYVDILEYQYLLHITKELQNFAPFCQLILLPVTFNSGIIAFIMNCQEYAAVSQPQAPG